MTKPRKPARTKSSDHVRKKQLHVVDEIHELSETCGNCKDSTHRILREVQAKVDKAEVLNGGFDRLYVKIESMETAQNQIVERVDSIHDAIFNPDEGIFSRLAQSKVDQIEAVNELDKQIVSISSWKDNQDKTSAKDAELTQKISDSLDEHRKLIDDFTKWKSIVTSVGKWTIAAIGGGAVSMVFKIVYDTITLHWK